MNCHEISGFKPIHLLILCGLMLLVTSCAVTNTNFGRSKKIMEAGANISIDADVQADFDTAVVFLKEKKYYEAITLLEKVTKRADRHTAPLINLGLAYVAIGDFKKAEERLKAALALNPRHLVANSEVGLLYRKIGRFQEAKSAYETALHASSQYQPARKNLGILCDVYLGDLKCALEHFNQYLAYSPDDEQVRIWVADLHNRLR